MLVCGPATFLCPLLQVLYAIALVPMGFLADQGNRPRLLAAGLAGWSLLTMTGSKVRHGLTLEAHC